MCIHSPHPQRYTPMTDPLVDLGDYEVPFKGIVEQSIAGIYILQDGVFQYVNETFARMCGLRREQLMGARLSEVANPAQVEQLMALYERRIRDEGLDEHFVIRRTSARNPGAFELHGRRIVYRGRPAIVGVGVDITEQERQRAEISAAHQRLQQLVANANSVRENERARLARELHDVVGGMLTAIKFDVSRLSWGLDLLQQSANGGHAAAVAPLSATTTQLLQLIQEAIDAVRAISEGLRPGALDHLGLAAALAHELERFEARYGLSCQFATDGTHAELDKEREVAVYRIFQEALNNVARHARATRLSVTLEGALPGWLVLRIDDNGRGLKAVASSPHGGLGLLGMQERARDLQGRLEITAGPDGGTRVTLFIPLHGGPSDAREDG